MSVTFAKKEKAGAVNFLASKSMEEIFMGTGFSSPFPNLSSGSLKTGAVMTTVIFKRKENETERLLAIAIEDFKSPDVAVRLRAYRTMSHNDRILRLPVNRRAEFEIRLLEETLQQQSSRT